MRKLFTATEPMASVLDLLLQCRAARAASVAARHEMALALCETREQLAGLHQHLASLLHSETFAIP